MNRIKALYRSRAIACAGIDVYQVQQREVWLEKLPEAGVRWRAGPLFSELDHLSGLRREARRAMVAECRRHPASKLLLRVPTPRHRAPRTVERKRRDSTSLSQETSVLVILRAGRRHEIERRLDGQRSGSRAHEEGSDDAWLDAQSQPDIEVCLQERGVDGLAV